MIEVAGPVEAAVIRAHDDGRVEVLVAPKVAEFSPSVLDQADPRVATVDAAGYLNLAGQATYRPVAFRQDLAGRLTLICERVR